MKWNNIYKTKCLLCFEDIKFVVNRQHAWVEHFHLLVKPYKGSAKRRYKKMESIMELFISSIATYIYNRNIKLPEILAPGYSNNQSQMSTS
jgi:hypothetical protein